MMIPHMKHNMTVKVKGILHKINKDSTNKDIQDNENVEYATQRPKPKLKWDEDKLQANEKTTKAKVLMKINEPNTPFIRYGDSLLEQKTGDDLEGFSLDDGINSEDDQHIINVRNDHEPDEWQQADEEERKIKETAERKYHDEFKRKRTQHYSHTGDVLRVKDVNKNESTIIQK